MKKSLRVGFNFGLTSGIITTLGLIVGLHAGTHSTLVVIGGVLTIAIADSFSDALGIHVSQESENRNSKAVWEATITTFLTKLIFALTFLVPLLLFDIDTAIMVSVVWGLTLLTILSYYIAKKQKEPAWKVILEHIIITLIVITITHYLGDWISIVFV
jgi:VIT1/CCC1 family predicted Fe2+/Mn2+ transporter